jgi:hypothetical protein
MSGGGGSGSSKTESGPPAWAVPYFQDLYTRAQTASQQIPGTPFPGPFVAPPNVQQLDALGMKEQLARSMPQNLGAGVMQLGQDTASGQYLNPSSNPYLQGTINAALQPLQTDFNNRYNQLNSSFQGAGAFDNIRRNFGISDLETQRAQALGGVSSQLAYQNYANERNLQMQAPQLISAGAQLNQIPSELLAQVGDVQRQFSQDAIANQQAMFEEQANAPFRPLMPLSNILSAISPGTTVKQTPNVNKTAQGITGALGGAATGAAIGSVVPVIGTGIGALGGAILGGIGGSL